jgi:carbonic anhydrase/acetyltransferase-like protein (isoleucine patch superfamily)
MAAGGDATVASGANLNLASGGGVIVNAPSDMHLEAGDLTVDENVNVTGQASVKGTVTSDIDVIGASISLVNHVHVETNSVTLPPTP